MGKYSTVTETPMPCTPMIRAPVKSETSRNMTFRAVSRLINLKFEMAIVIEAPALPQLRRAVFRHRIYNRGRSRRQRRKKLRDHLSREFFEDENLPRHVTGTRMSDCQVEQREVPLWHYLDEQPLANQVRLYNWG